MSAPTYRWIDAGSAELERPYDAVPRGIAVWRVERKLSSRCVQRFKIVQALEAFLSASCAFWQLDDAFPFGGSAIVASFAEGSHIELGVEVSRASKNTRSR